jgi:hypothetical protein
MRRNAISLFCGLWLISLLIAQPLPAAQSTITEGEGYACMGVDKSKKQTEREAMDEARRSAVERAVTYVKSSTEVKDYQVVKDLLEAYAAAKVKIVEELQKGWYRDAAAGDCYSIRIKAEVIPDEKAIEGIWKSAKLDEDPSAPLSVSLWTDKKDYRQGERMKIYLKGNKPFYARVLLRDAKGELVQLFPNPYRKDNYFNGGATYEIPSGRDQFELEISPPFGEENIVLFASTTPLGDIALAKEGPLYQVKTRSADVSIRTRGVKLSGKAGGGEADGAEFVERQVRVTTVK